MKIILQALFIMSLSFSANSTNLSEVLVSMGTGETTTTQDVGNGEKVTFTFNKTSKGNGTLLLGDHTLLRIMDTHDDGYYYKEGLLRVDFEDITGDNLKELIISGIVLETSEKEVVTNEYPLVMIYSYKNGMYQRVYKHAPIEIDMALMK